MSKTTVELDFFRIERQNSSKFRPVEPKNTIRGIQSAISRINPQLLRSVIGSRAPNGKLDVRSPVDTAFTPVNLVHPPSPTTDVSRTFRSQQPTPIPVLNQAFRSALETPQGSAQLTIFYNGQVTVFDVPQDKAETIIKLAEEVNVGSVADRPDSVVSGFGHDECLLEKLDGDLPIARRKSLQRFLEMRKERLTASGPYGSSSNVDLGWLKKPTGC